MDAILKTTRGKMQAVLDLLRQDFASVHVGKASPSLVENIVINAYGGTQKFKLMELATIHAPDIKTLIISPFDQSIIAEIQNGIQEAKLGLSGVVNADIIRINIPPLTEERRKELVKAVNQKSENGRIMLRQERHQAMEEIKKRRESGSVSEDEVTRLEKEIQKLTDEFMEKIDGQRLEKEKDLMTI